MQLQRDGQGHLTIEHDGSPLAAEVKALLTTLPLELQVIPMVLVVMSGGRHDAQFLQELNQQHPPSLEHAVQPPRVLVSDDPQVLEQGFNLVDDLLLWPASAQVFAARFRVLQHWYWSRSELQRAREALIWHDSRSDREHQLVEHIFANALSRNFLDYPNIQTYLSPVSKFNGDLCLVAAGPLGNIYLLMADFTGHGLAPATGALPLSQAFFAMADRGVSIAEMVTEFNFRLNRLLPDDMFCACLLLELSANGQRITYWNGGMPAALVCDPHGQVLHRLAAQHMALGVLDDDDFDSRVATLRVATDSFVVTYTDGVTELLGSTLEFLGMDALESLLRRHPSAAQFSDLVGELELFRGEQPLRDDLSLALLRCVPTGLDESKPVSEDRGMPFHFQTELSVAELQQVEPIGYVLNAVSQLPRIRAHRTNIYLLLAEAFNNALEHGLLQLDSRWKESPDGFAHYYVERAQRLAQLQQGWIRIAVDYFPDTFQLAITVSDSGCGFTPESAAAEAAQQFGRGLELLRQLSSHLEWRDEGREIYFVYQL